MQYVYFLAHTIALFINCLGYYLSIMSTLNSWSLRSLFIGLVHALIIQGLGDMSLGGDSDSYQYLSLRQAGTKTICSRQAANRI